MNRNRGTPGVEIVNVPVKVSLLTYKDAPEYERLKNALIETLKRLGAYEPAIDDMHIDAVVRASIYCRKNEVFLDSKTATAHTYASVADSQLKWRKVVEGALNALAVSRRDRLGGQTEKGIRDELREALLEAVKAKDAGR